MQPIQIDVFYPIPEGWGMCNPCELMMSQAGMEPMPEARGLDELPAEMYDELQHLSSVLFTLADRFQAKVQIKVWDPRSLQGMLLSIRHGVRRYPTFIVDGRFKLVGWELDKLITQLQSIIGTRISAL